MLPSLHDTASDNNDVANTAASLDREHLDRAISRMKRRKKLATRAAEEEEHHQEMCMLANSMQLEALADNRTNLTTPAERKCKEDVVQAKPVWTKGSFVHVTAKSSPGFNRPEGYGFVEKAYGTGADTVIDVKYPYDRSLHKGITLDEATTCNIRSFFCDESPTRQRTQTRRFTPSSSPHEPQEKRKTNTKTKKKKTEGELLLDELKFAHTHGWGEGWRRKVLELYNVNDETNKMKTHLTHEEKNQLLMEGAILEMEIERQGGNRHLKRNRKGQITKRKTKFNPMTIKYLVEKAWGLNEDYLRKLRLKAKRANGGNSTSVLRLPPPEKKKSNTKPRSVIESREAAKKYYTAYRLFIIHSCQKNASKNFGSDSRADYCWRRIFAENDWLLSDEKTKALWEEKARAHNERFPEIKTALLEQLHQNPSSSWKVLSDSINGWCSASTIQRWLQSYLSYGTYSEMITPLLSEPQKKKHLAFAKRYRNNWYRGKGKYLVINYDEKWFWGLVLRAAAKECPELGVNPRTAACYHKNHIEKVMVVAFTGFAYKDSMENGGIGLKLGCYRAQAAKVAKKTVRESRRTDDGVRALPQTISVSARFILSQSIYNVSISVTFAIYATENCVRRSS